MDDLGIIHWLHYSVNWGVVASWLTVIATFGALRAAVKAGHWAEKMVNLEFSRDEERDFQARMSQASQVGAWVESSVIKPVSVAGRWPSFGAAESVSGLVVNRSSQPIFRLEIIWILDSEILRHDYRSVLAPDMQVEFKLERTEILTAAGVATEQHGFVSHSLDEAVLLSEKAASRLLLEIHFMDSANLLWFRDRYGRLQEEEAPAGC